MKSKIYQVEVFEDGTTYWTVNRKFHREDGPAVKWANGSEKYYLNDKLHREDGPAVKLANGTEEYWLNNKKYSKEDFDKEISKRKNKVKKIKKSLACENKEVMIDGVKYRLTKV